MTWNEVSIDEIIDAAIFTRPPNPLTHPDGAGTPAKPSRLSSVLKTSIKKEIKSGSYSRKVFIDSVKLRLTDIAAFRQIRRREETIIKARANRCAKVKNAEAIVAAAIDKAKREDVQPIIKENHEHKVYS